MFASRGFRLSALFAVLVALFSFSAMDAALARSGGSFGSRGMRTYQSVPATPTISSPTGAVQRSMTTPGSTTTAAATAGATASAARTGLFGGMGGWILGGFLGAGLFGLMFGGGFGGIGGVIALLVQILVIVLVARALFGRFARPAAAGGYGNPYSYAPQGRQSSPGGRTAAGASSAASQRAGSRDEIGVTSRDLATFEQRLCQLQDAYAREDYDALRKISTPEVMSYLSEELAQNAAKGLRNEVFDVALLSGDVAEAWREADRDYVTVALRYESRDVMRERASGQIVSGDEGVSSKSEVWTFVRRAGGEWIISAIQGA